MVGDKDLAKGGDGDEEATTRMATSILHSQYFTLTVHVAACKLYRNHVGHIHDNAAGHNHDNVAGHNHENSTCIAPGITTAKICICNVYNFIYLCFCCLFSCCLTV